MAYCPKILPDHSNLEEAAAAARYSEGDYLYRVYAQRYSYIVDADREEYGTTDAVLEISAHPVHKWTPCGATLKEYSGSRRRFVNLESHKQFASRTPQEAMESFAARRRRQIYILNLQLQRAEDELALAMPKTGIWSPRSGGHQIMEAL